jgi:hypothetical protein
MLSSPFSPIDIRTVGLILSDDFSSGASFRECCDIWARDDSIAVSQRADGTYLLRLEHDGRRSKELLEKRTRTYIPQTLCLDERQGFAPIRLSYSASDEKEHPDPFILICTVRWNMQDGIWVPADLSIESRTRGRLLCHYALSFEWLSVNTDIDPALFTADGLGAPVGTPVVDYREAYPREVGRIKGLPGARH